MSKQIFVSYSTDDTTVATACDALEARGIACWMAPRDIVSKSDYGEQIIDAIEQAVVLLLILSEGSNNSVFVRPEVERAVSKGKVIIPFRIQPVQPSRSLEFFISNYQWIDGWQVPAEKSWDTLFHAVRSHLDGEESHLPTPLSPAQPSSPVAPNNLPHQLTPFIGRERELADLEHLLAEADVRLITILGPGGMGKTRLSLALAERHLSDPRFAHGLFFVALAPLSESQHIVLSLAEAISFSLQPGANPRAIMPT